ncbi:MAG: hypothetical protein RBS43_06950 [Candidatus Cloacimonas sp.]|jgi:hypothetical protein|nr:hypothetical protein [Candidatus Cloacimonas sp.]
MTKQLYIIIGAYGSGKSEYAIHLARKLNDAGEDVILADMDVVNPYFRARDVREDFAKLGIDVIAPEGEFKHADLPMLSPRIKGAIENQNKTVILDVGGDPAGCRTLGRFVDSITKRGYRMLFVVNTKRPFTSNPEEILLMKQMLEFTSKLQITEFVCNTNLMQFTDTAIVNEGIYIIREAADACEIPFNTYLVLSEYETVVPTGIQNLNREVMNYTLRKPWELLISKGI